MVASWRDSLEPKCANRPLLLIPSSFASSPMLRPSSPSTVASSAAIRKMSALVRAPLVLFRVGISFIV